MRIAEEVIHLVAIELAVHERLEKRKVWLVKCASDIITSVSKPDCFRADAELGSMLFLKIGVDDIDGCCHFVAKQNIVGVVFMLSPVGK